MNRVNNKIRLTSSFEFLNYGLMVSKSLLNPNIQIIFLTLSSQIILNNHVSS